MKHYKSVKFLLIRILFCPVIFDGAAPTAVIWNNIAWSAPAPRSLGQRGPKKEPRNIQLCGSESDERTE